MTGRALCHIHGLDRAQRKQLGKHAGKKSGVGRRLQSIVHRGLLPLDVAIGPTPEPEMKITKSSDAAEDEMAANALTELYFLRHSLLPGAMPTQVRDLFLGALRKGLDFDAITLCICELPKGAGPGDVMKRAKQRARGRIPGPGQARP